MQTIFQEDFALLLQEELLEKHKELLKQIKKSSDETLYDWFETAPCILPLTLCDDKMGHFFQHKPKDLHCTAASIGNKLIWMGDDTRKQHIMLQFIVPDLSEDSEIDVELMEYLALDPNIINNLRSQHHYGPKSKSTNKKIQAVLKSFEALSFRDQSICLHEILKSESTKTPPEDYPYRPDSETKDPEILTQTSTSTAPETFNLSGADTSDIYDDDSPPTATKNFQKLALYLPRDNFVESILKFAKASDLISGNVKTRIAKKFDATLVGYGKDLECFHNLCETNKTYTCLPFLRIKGYPSLKTDTSAEV